MTTTATQYNFDLFQGFDNIPWNESVVSKFMSESKDSRANLFSLNNWVTVLLDSNNRIVESNRDIYNPIISGLNIENIFGSFNTTSTTPSGSIENQSRHIHISEDINVSSDIALHLFKEKYYPEFQGDLKAAGIDEESIDFLYERLSQLMTINREASLLMIQNIYLESRENPDLDVDLTLKILRIIHRFDYNEMRPYSQLIVDSAIHTNNQRIQLEGLNVVDRWGNKEALNMLEKMECPSHPWTKLKFNTLINTLRNGLSAGA